MRACSSASGGVIFVPDNIERKTKSVSYKDLAQQENPAKRSASFGKRKTKSPAMEDAA